MRMHAVVALLTATVACAPVAHEADSDEITREADGEDFASSADTPQSATGAAPDDRAKRDVAAAQGASQATRDLGRAPAASGAEFATQPSPRELMTDASVPPIYVDAGPAVDADVRGGAGPEMVKSDAGTSGSVCSYPHYPKTAWVASEWIPFATADQLDARALLDAVHSSIVGSWHGLASTPWTTPYEVDLRFEADGRYSGRCSNLPDDCCAAFYYGTNDASELKRYRILDATLSGNVFGEIDVVFAYGSEYGLPAWQGELSHMERDASGNGLRFEFKTSSGYGPVTYDLRRVF